MNLYFAGIGLMVFCIVAGGESVGKLERKDAAFDRIAPEGTIIERVGTGFKFTEGPVWIEKSVCLLFSDIPANRIYQWREAKGFEVFREPSGNSNGLTLDKRGCLIACEHSNRRVTRTKPDGTINVLADNFEGKRLNSPNDVVVKSDGSIYFTDPPYGLGRQQEGRELPFNGVYRISPDGKELKLLSDDFDRPNGLAFSRDEKVLYIGDSGEPKHIRVFEVQPDGTLANGRIFAVLKTGEPGSPDGMKVDVEGNLYATGPAAVWVFNPEGKLLGRIVPPEIPANCAWGGPDWKTLYITARNSLYSVKLGIRGITVP